jgi:catechol 2,3-dioxygenase-like lactoylglutathione lyase family enzyme
VRGNGEAKLGGDTIFIHADSNVSDEPVRRAIGNGQLHPRPAWKEDDAGHRFDERERLLFGLRRPALISANGLVAPVGLKRRQIRGAKAPQDDSGAYPRQWIEYSRSHGIEKSARIFRAGSRRSWLGTSSATDIGAIPDWSNAVKPRITLITLGVDNLDRAVKFYGDGLGLATDGIVGAEHEFGAVAFFELQDGLKLALWPRKSLAHDSGLAITAPSPTDMSLAHNVTSRAEVDAVMAQALSAGATLVKKPNDTFYGGYAGYFKDPDQPLWEVAWNPQIMPPR